ncbi:MAG: bifunctional phosphoribosylaminoimidazolecarboxamide formyltransferase/IMP cyclohydrolase [Fimbriimonadaceae bacterium]|nr:bifunctional phosphoribosylaminoimidazolecarboxamide formyltransferase/IMP cyclohydrolase [Fimbriimonadaceae bacterium]
MKRRALLSVTDKTGLLEFARGLSALGFELISTGGTANALRSEGLEVTEVSDLTGFPEMLGGRVKTLHPIVHGGILGDTRDASHRAQMAEAAIEPIELVCVNLYAFEQTISQPHSFDDAIESIDIGGPTLIRAAAKNSANVIVVVDPNDYEQVVSALASETAPQLRRELMAKAFRHTAYYDSVIARYLEPNQVTETATVGYRLRQVLRYGENPHQDAALYTDPLQSDGVAQGAVIWGKELSYNNLLDADAAWELVSDMPPLSCAIIKHGNPCGAAVSDQFAQSYQLARASDPISAFGGIAAFNGPVDQETAVAMTEKGNFLEVVIATSFSDEARAVFANKSGWGETVRLLECPVSVGHQPSVLRPIRGGALWQKTKDSEPTWQVVTERSPTDEEWAGLKLMWTVVKHVKSNAIVVGTGTRLLGTGAGQMNRVQSVRLALEQAGDAVKGACLASDAFFPFSDSVETAAQAGVAAIVQPGGSKKDADSINAANRLGLAMVLTGIRQFRH